MKYLSVRNWAAFQHYRDRDPLWIKVYGRLLDDGEFLALPEAAQAQLMKLWLLASRCRNRIRDDAQFLKHALHTKRLYIDVLVTAGFLERSTSTALADREHDASPHVRPPAPGEGETETEGEAPPPAREASPQVERFLADMSPSQRQSWQHLLAGWRDGMGYPGGRAADPADIDVGVMEYLAVVDEPQRDYSPRHVVQFVESARIRRVTQGPREGRGRAADESTAEQAMRVAATLESLAGGQAA